MNQEITPNIQNSNLLRQVIDMKIKQAQKENYPSIKDILRTIQ